MDRFFQTLTIAFGVSVIAFWGFPILYTRGERWFKSARFVLWLTTPGKFAQVMDRLFVLIIAVAMLGMPAQSLHHYWIFNSFSDFIDFDQTLVPLMRGGGIASIINFSRRFNPILIALVPLYTIWDDPRVLLGVQSLGFVLGALPLYWFARRRIGHFLALIVALAFLVSPSIQSVNQPVFYEIKLAIPLLAFAIFFLLRNRYVPFLVTLGVALLLKQEIAFIALGFAGYIILAQRRYALGIALAGIGTGLAIFVIQFLYPLFNQGRAYPQFAERYGYLGNSLTQVLLTLLTRPDIAFQHAFTPSKVLFLFFLLTPVAFLPALGFQVTAIALPALAYTLLSELPQQTNPQQYYQAPLIPFLFFGTVLALEHLLRWRAQNGFGFPRRKFALGILVLASSTLYLPSTWTHLIDPASFQIDPHTAIGHALMNEIPGNKSVAAQTEFFIPFTAQRAQQVLLFTPHGDYRKVDYLFGDTTRTYYQLHRAAWDHWRVSGFFEPVHMQDGYFLMRRIDALDPARQVDNGWAVVGFISAPNRSLTPSQTRFGDQIALLGFAVVPSEKIRGGETLRVIVEWRAERAVSESYVMLAQLLDARGNVWAQDDRAPVIQTQKWNAGDLIRDQITFDLPRVMPPGEYRIALGFWDPRANKRLEIFDGQAHGVEIQTIVSVIQVEKDTTSIIASALPLENPLIIDLAQARLIGTTQLPTDLKVGDEISVGLYWRAREKPRGDYIIAVQLSDHLGRVAVEDASRPAAGAYPTLQWHIGEVLLDLHSLNVPANLMPGTYTWQIVLRDAVSGAVLGETALAKISITQ